MNKDHFIVGLDIGTYYIKASAIATDDKSTVYESLVESKDNFLNIRDPKYLKQQILKSIGILEEKINNKIENVYLTIDLEFTNMKKSEGIILLEDETVKEKDIVKAIDKSLAQVKLNDETVVDTVVSRYLVDGTLYENPVGVQGKVLEVNLVAFFSDNDYIESQRKLLNALGFNLVGVALSSNTASNVLLTENDKEKGTFLIDVGASKTRIVYYIENELKAAEVFPFGGQSITNDIAIVLEKSRGESETLKKSLSKTEISEKKDSYVNSKEKSKDLKENEEYKLIFDIVKARIVDMTENINQFIDKNEKNIKGKKAVVYGGGLSNFKNISKVVNNNIIIPTNVITSDIIEGNSIFMFQVSGLVYSILEVLSYTIYKVDESKKNLKDYFKKEEKADNLSEDLKEGLNEDRIFNEKNENVYYIEEKKEENEKEYDYNNEIKKDTKKEEKKLTWFQKFLNKFLR